MTIDEYLDQQQEMGNILQGGGPSTSEEVDQARKDEQGEKEDDTQRGYDEEEKTLRKTREFDDYRDTHRKGEGNMWVFQSHSNVRFCGLREAHLANSFGPLEGTIEVETQIEHVSLLSNAIPLLSVVPPRAFENRC